MEIATNNEFNLDNNYYLKIIINENGINTEFINIENLRISFISKNKLILKIDFNKFNKKEYKKILRKLLFIKKIFSKNKIGIKETEKTFLGYVLNYDENNKDYKDFITAINAIFYNTKYERYNYIYDTVCDYLDGYFYGKNLCDFKDNQCGEKKGTSSYIGCCHHFKCKPLGPLTKLVPCEYLSKDYKCGAKCLPCKLFTCIYLEKKGVKFRIKDILLLNVFFNPIQKYFIKYMVYTPKEKILKRLVKL